MPDDLTIEPMREIRIEPRAQYLCSHCGAWHLFAFRDPEYFTCGSCKRSVVPYADG